jgi:hypothetical protein
MVQNLAAAGIDQERIAAAVGCSHPTLRKNYKTELAVSKTQVTAMAQSQLFAAIKKGELAAIFFWLKTRERWHETDAHRFVDEKGKDRDLNAAEILSSRIAGVAARIGAAENTSKPDPGAS